MTNPPVVLGLDFGGTKIAAAVCDLAGSKLGSTVVESRATDGARASGNPDQHGRGPDTELRRAVPAHFGLSRVEDVTLGLYRGTISYAQLPGLTPVLLAVAKAGDEVARAVVLRQADEVCAMATIAARNLGLTDGATGGAPVPVVLGGSVLAARDPLLTSAITERLAKQLPDAEVRIIDAPPILGAALLGLDHLGAPPGAAARLRECARACW